MSSLNELLRQPTTPSNFRADLLAERRAIMRDALGGRSDYDEQPNFVEQLLGGAWSAAGSAFSGLISVLDAPRQAIHAAGWGVAGKSWDDAWELAESGTNILKGAGWEAEEDSWGSWGRGAVGLAIDIASDPLTWVGVGALTKGGRLAQKGGKLTKEVTEEVFNSAFKNALKTGSTKEAAEAIATKATARVSERMTAGVSGLAPAWAEQAALGQRAALVFRAPWYTKTLLEAPGFVGTEAKIGQWLAQKAPIIKGLVRRFSTTSLNPRVNELVHKVRAQHGNNAVKVLKWYDEATSFMKGLDPKDFEDITHYAEAYGKTGPQLQRFVKEADAAWPEAKRLMGQKYAEATDAFKKLASDFNVGFEDINSSIEKRLGVQGALSDKAMDALKQAEDAGVFKPSARAKALISELRTQEGVIKTSASSLDNIGGISGKTSAAANATKLVADDLNNEIGKLTSKLMAQTMPRHALREVLNVLSSGAVWEEGATIENVIKTIASDTAPVEQLSKRLVSVLSKEEYATLSVSFDRIERLKRLRQTAGETAVTKLDDTRDWLRRTGQEADVKAAAARAELTEEGGKIFDAARKLGKAAKEPKLNIKALRGVQNNAPNYLYRELTPEAQKYLGELGQANPAAANRVWSSEMQGMLSYRFATDTIIGGKKMKTPLALADIKRTLKASDQTLRLREFADMAAGGDLVISNKIKSEIANTFETMATRAGSELTAGQKETAMGVAEAWRKFIKKPGDVDVAINAGRALLDSSTGLPAIGEGLQPWREFIKTSGGILPAISRAFGRAPKGAADDIGRIFNLSPADSLTKMKDKLLDAMQGSQMWGELANSPELFSSVAKPGWTHIKDIGPGAVDAFKALSVDDAWVSPETFEELRKVYTNFSNPANEGVLQKSWRWFTKEFKWHVTKPAPAYHARNHIEDSIRMLYNGPYNTGTVHSAMVKGWLRNSKKKGIIKLGDLGERSAQDAWRLAEAFGIVGTGQVSTANNKSWTWIGRTIDKTQALEDGRRFGYWVERLNKGFSPYQAAQEVKKVLFDYTDLSDFERQTMSHIIPFYSYLRSTIKLHAQTLVQNPALLTAQQRVIERMQGDPPEGETPDWVRNRLFVSLGPDEQTGDERLLSVYGLPLHDMSELLDGQGDFKKWFQQFAFRTHPIPRAAVRLGMALKADYPTRSTRLAKLALPEAMEEMMGIREHKDKKSGETYITMDPAYDRIVESVFMRYYSTAKAWDRDVTREKSWPELLARPFAGVSTVTYAPGKERKRQERRELQDATDRAMRRGDVAPLPGFYKPKDSGMSELRYLLMQNKKKKLYQKKGAPPFWAK